MLTSSIYKMLIILAVIFCCSPGKSTGAAPVSGTEIRQIELDGSVLIDTSPANYAMASPDFGSQQNNWKSISVNGDQVTILTTNCQTIVEDTKSLSQSERALITNIASRLIVADSIGNSNQQQSNGGRFSASRFSLGPGGSTRFSQSRGMSMSSFQSNGISVNKYDDRNYSISKAALPNGISRLFVSNGDLITFVYSDGRVLMKPIACLSSGEGQLVHQLQTEAQQAQRQFEANMNQMQHNLNRNMINMQQSMQQNMANIFSAGFPFSQAGQAQAFAGPSQFRGFNYGYSQYGAPAYAAAGAGAGAGANPFMAPIAPIAPLAPMQPIMNQFGNNFPFGSHNSPFGAGFPFNG